MSHNITVEGGKSVRLPTAGKYCDRDIVITAEGGAEDLDAVLTEQEELIAELQDTLRGKAVGGEPVIEPLEITENGTYTAPDGVDGYSPVTVNVNVPAGGSEDDWIENGGTTYTNDRVVKIGAYVFQGNTVLASVSFPNVLSVGASAFNNCKVLATVDLPEVTSISGSAFYQSPKVADFYAPKVKTLGNNVLRGNAIPKVIFPELTSLGTYAFTSCTKLEYADLGSASSLGTYVFNGCTALETLILRRESLVSLTHATNVFANTPIANGTGYIYVPSALVDSYKTATNWSTYAAQIRAIEDYPEICGGEA